jgi:hypothetical protein
MSVTGMKPVGDEKMRPTAGTLSYNILRCLDDGQENWENFGFGYMYEGTYPDDNPLEGFQDRLWNCIRPTNARYVVEAHWLGDTTIAYTQRVDNRDLRKYLIKFEQVEMKEGSLTWTTVEA